MTVIPVQVTFRGLPHSDSLETDIRERVGWLEQFYQGIMSCHVVVDIPHRHHEEGQHVRVRIDLTIPHRGPLVVSHEPSLHGPLKNVEAPAHRKETELQSEHRYAAVAVREAFDVMRRRLQDAAREVRGAVKVHELPAHGHVVELSKPDGYGFIAAGERRLYFHRASVLDQAFDHLEVGTPVAFVEEQGDEGPQASTVRVLGKHHYVAP